MFGVVIFWLAIIAVIIAIYRSRVMRQREKKKAISERRRIVENYVMTRSPRYTFLDSAFEQENIERRPFSPLHITVPRFSTKRDFDKFNPETYITDNAEAMRWASRDGQRVVKIVSIINQAPELLDDDNIRLVYFMDPPKIPVEKFVKLWHKIEMQACDEISYGLSSSRDMLRQCVVISWSYTSPKGRNYDRAQRVYSLAEALSIIQDEKAANQVSSIDGMEGHAFEHWCAKLLQKCGFTGVEVTRGSGDQGVDVIGMYQGRKWAVQCKNYAKPLGNKPIQEVVAGAIFYNCECRAVMTNQTFTKGAKELAAKTDTVLIDRSEITRMTSYAARNK